MASRQGGAGAASAGPSRPQGQPASVQPRAIAEPEPRGNLLNSAILARIEKIWKWEWALPENILKLVQELLQKCQAVIAMLDRSRPHFSGQAIQTAAEHAYAVVKDVLDRCETMQRAASGTGMKKAASNEDISRGCEAASRDLEGALGKLGLALVHELMVVSVDNQLQILTLLGNTDIIRGLASETLVKVGDMTSQLKMIMDNGPRYIKAATGPTDEAVIISGMKTLLSASYEYPESIELSGELILEEPPTYQSAYTAVYAATYKERPVAVKRFFREPKTRGLEHAKKFRYEGVIWKMLDHTNVLPFFGIHTSATFEVGLVSAWVEGGDVMTYLAKHEDARVGTIIKGVADGLTYLHERNIVHGDLRACNILVDEDMTQGDWIPHPRICDFGLAACATTAREILYHGTLSAQQAKVYRYYAPERFNLGAQYNFPTLASDVFCFGGTIYHILTKVEPFFDYEPILATRKFERGDVPTRPGKKSGAPQTSASNGRALTMIEEQKMTLEASEVSDVVWNLLCRMWKVSPEERVRIQQVQATLQDNRCFSK